MLELSIVEKKLSVDCFLRKDDLRALFAERCHHSSSPCSHSSQGRIRHPGLPGIVKGSCPTHAAGHEKAKYSQEKTNSFGHVNAKIFACSRWQQCAEDLEGKSHARKCFMPAVRLCCSKKVPRFAWAVAAAELYRTT